MGMTSRMLTEASRYNSDVQPCIDTVPALRWADGKPVCPKYDGEGAESFGTLLRRAEEALARVQALPEDALLYVFSHGQFI